MHRTLDSTRYDAVVIGSGIGGLGAASLLAQVAGMRVLVLERHFRLGGLTQTFTRRRFTWDVGVHYVGEVGEGSQARALLDFATGGRLQWERMPSPFERFSYPGLEFAVRDDPDAYAADLTAAFPAEIAAIRRWFRDVARAHGWFVRQVVSHSVPAPIAPFLRARGRSLALARTGEVLARTFRDPRLRAVAASQWGDYGLPPGESAFGMHALIAAHYLHGAYYPRGGGAAIAPGMVDAVEARGGACVVNAEVTEILLDGDRAVGVRVRGSHGEEREIRAPIVVSDAGSDLTFRRLLHRGDPEAPPHGGSGTSAVQLFLGLSGSPAALGFRGENVWLFTDFDHDRAWARRNALVEGRAASAFLSFPSLRDPSARAHTAEIVALVDAEPFARWRDLPWRRRGDDYEALKGRIATALLELVESRFPGFRDLVAYQELATPISVEHFTGARRGLLYGAPGTPERLRDLASGARTAVRGLYLTGADASSPGIVGAFMGAASATAAVLGPLGFPRLVAAARSSARARARSAVDHPDEAPASAAGAR